MTIVIMALDFVACVALMATAAWLLTDRNLSRTARTACALIASGACVDAIGMYGMLLDLDGPAYGDVWPSEALVDLGFAVLMIRWTWRLRLAAAEPVCP
jgi:hypothetical protein